MIPASKVIKPCLTPGCTTLVERRALPPNRKNDISEFCKMCRNKHSHRALVSQVEHGKSIRNVLIDAAFFKSANGMSDYLGVSFVTIYNWIKKYFDMNFQEFRRTHICKSSDCYILNIERSSYSRDDYVLKKIKKKFYCACINALDPGLIMTNCPPHIIRTILRGQPRIEKITDSYYSLTPTPVKRTDVHPVYFA